MYNRKPENFEPESEISEYLKKRIEKELGGLCRKYHNPSHTGMPDRDVLLLGGYVCFVELKTITGHRSKLQRKAATWLVNNGFNYRLIVSKKEVDEFIDYLKNYVLL